MPINLPPQYEIIRKIDEGGMARVYLARDKKNGQLVAIKTLLSSKDDVISKKRFLNEMKLMLKIQCNNVVKIYDFENSLSRKFIVMEYIEGETLRDYIKYRSSLSPPEAVRIAKQLAIGLQAMHTEGIIHRDIKSQNVMIAEKDGTAKLIDLGIAINEESVRLTKQNHLIGSVQYIAPELSSGSPPSEQTDIYALGILFYEMLIGEVPFGGDQKQILKAHLNSDIEPVNNIASHISQSVANVVAKSTAKNPIHRYKNASEMFNDLSTVLDDRRLNEPTYNPIKGTSTQEKNKFIAFMSSKFGYLSMVLVLLLIIIIILLLGVFKLL
ncbi:MAG: serine/threonine protein kinase [Mycoplasma sp.]|nr:serine/threonine protein kinase [Mycoplasma sp.]